MSNQVTGMKKMTTVIVMIAVGVFQSLIVSSAIAQVAPKMAGDLLVTGSVSLNGANAVSGATVFDGGLVKTASNSSAVINLGRQGQIELGPESELILKLENGILGGNLRSGHTVVNAPAGVAVNILTADGLAVADGITASVITVDISCGNTRVSSARSNAKVTAGNRVEIVAAGQEVAVGAQDTSRCPRMAAARAKMGTGLTGGALAALILVGLGGAIAGVIAATQGDNTSFNATGPLSNFRP